VVVGTAPGSSNLGTFDVGSQTSISGALAPGRYYACVMAVNNRGTSGPSNEVAFTVGGTTVAAGAPRNLAASSSGATVSLAWLPPASGGAVSSYALRVGSASGLSDIYSGDIGAVTSFAAVVPSRRYFIRVVALNAAGASAPSNEVRVDIAAACALPTAPALRVSRSGTQVTAAWTVPSGGPVTHYVVRAGRASGGADLFNGSVGLTNRASAALSRGTYYIRVAAATACGVGAQSTEAVVVVP
jgi:predicted phage tail protein